MLETFRNMFTTVTTWAENTNVLHRGPMPAFLTSKARLPAGGRTDLAKVFGLFRF